MGSLGDHGASRCRHCHLYPRLSAHSNGASILQQLLRPFAIPLLLQRQRKPKPEPKRHRRSESAALLEQTCYWPPCHHRF